MTIFFSPFFKTRQVATVQARPPTILYNYLFDPSLQKIKNPNFN